MLPAFYKVLDVFGCKQSNFFILSRWRTSFREMCEWAFGKLTCLSAYNPSFSFPLLNHPQWQASSCLLTCWLTYSLARDGIKGFGKPIRQKLASKSQETCLAPRLGLISTMWRTTNTTHLSRCLSKINYDFIASMECIKMVMYLECKYETLDWQSTRCLCPDKQDSSLKKGWLDAWHIPKQTGLENNQNTCIPFDLPCTGSWY